MLLVVCFLLPIGCQNKQNAEEPSANQPDLSKAATFNMQLGLGYLKRGDRSRAKKKLLLALKQEPSSPDINAAMAYYLEQSNEMEQARKYYLKAISLSDNSGPQLNNFGTFLCRQGDYLKAEVYFLKAVKDSQYLNVASAYENAGLCALAVPDEKKAKLFFTKALAQDPSRKESLYELTKIISKEGTYAEALALLQQHADLVLDDKLFLVFAKEIALKAGKPDVAAQYETNLSKLDLNPDTSGVNNEYDSGNG